MSVLCTHEHRLIFPCSKINSMSQSLFPFRYVNYGGVDDVVQSTAHLMSWVFCHTKLSTVIWPLPLMMF